MKRFPIIILTLLAFTACKNTSMDISQNEIPVEECFVSQDSTKAYSSATTTETEETKSFSYSSAEEYYEEYPEEMKFRYPYT